MVLQRGLALISLQEVGVCEGQHLESYFECGVIL